jgi:hypothetical protein
MRSTRRWPACDGIRREFSRGKKGKIGGFFLLTIALEGFLNNRAQIYTPYPLRKREYYDMLSLWAGPTAEILGSKCSPSSNVLSKPRSPKEVQHDHPWEK